MDLNDNLKIDYSLKDINDGKTYEIKIENIYDPSKLWIIVYFQELKLFMRYLKTYYGNIENRIRVPVFKLEKYLTCVIESNSNFYRATILPLLLPEGEKVRVFLVDYGKFVNVEINNIYYILQKHCVVPRFALRACLLYIAPPSKLIIVVIIKKHYKKPVAGSNDSPVWTSKEQLFLTELIVNKHLYAKIEGINEDNKILYIDLFRGGNTELVDRAESITMKMLKANMASPAISNPSKYKKLSKYISTVKYLYLYPTIEAIEEGKVPSSLWELNLVKDHVTLDLLLYPLYKYVDINAQV